jgi:hypothetical protein
LIRRSGTNESVSAYFSMTPHLEFPFQKVTIQILADGALRADHQVSPLEADYAYGGAGGYYYGSAYRQLGDGISLYLYSSDYGNCWDGLSAEIYQSASDFVYHSEWHDYYWGTSEVDGHERLGTLLDASSAIEIRFLLDHAAGTFGGTTGPIPVVQYPYNYEWNYEYPDYGFYRGYDRGDQFSGYSYGILTP